MGPGRPTTRGAASPRGIAVSLALHLVLLALALRAVPDAPPPPRETTVAVKIVSPPAPAPEPMQPPVLPDAPAVAAASGAPASQEPRAPAARPPARDRVVRAQTMLAASVLADPRSRQAREEWRKLYPDERIIQLCNLEAMEQVHAWKPALEPDFVVAYARADIRLDGDLLRADGAALRDHRAWFEIAYRCEVTPDTEAVVAFEFELGEAIPESRWEDLMLPSGDGPAD